MRKINRLFRYHHAGGLLTLALSCMSLADGLGGSESMMGSEPADSVLATAPSICQEAVTTYLGRPMSAQVPDYRLRPLPGFGAEVQGQMITTNPLGQSVQTSYACRLRNESGSLSLESLQITDSSL